MLEITVSHWPFSDQFQHLAVDFGQPNLLYIFNGMAIDNLQKCPIFKNGRLISDPYFYRRITITYVHNCQLNYLLANYVCIYYMAIYSPIYVEFNYTRIIKIKNLNGE